MSEEKDGQEPTMEEILASIRRIISEDGDEPEAAETDEAEEEAVCEPEMDPEPEPERAADPEPEPAPEPEEEDVLELTNALPEEEPEPEMAADPEPEPEREPEPEVSFIDPEIMEEASAAAEPDDIKPVKDDRLLSAEAEAATSTAFGALANTLLTSSGGSRTLEDLVVDMLKPMLKNWLDQNLPPMVERLVKEEIERVARRGR